MIEQGTLITCPRCSAPLLRARRDIDGGDPIAVPAQFESANEALNDPQWADYPAIACPECGRSLMVEDLWPYF